MKVLPKLAYPEDPSVIFLKLIKFFDPNASILIQDGYCFGFNAHLKGKRIINYPGNLYHQQNFNLVQFKILNKFLDPSNENLDKKEQYGNILASEYKIHLMPKPEYMLPVVALLFQACARDKELSELIHQIKIQMMPNKKNTNGQIMPRVVIYPILGKANAQMVLNKIYALFSNYVQDNIFDDQTPRFNAKVTPLIYYAQSGGDIKNRLLDPENCSFLSESQVHFSWAGQRLTIPTAETGEIGCELLKVLNDFKDILWDLVKTAKEFKSIEVHAETVRTPGTHYRLWVEKTAKDIPNFEALLAVFSQYGIRYQLNSKGVGGREFLAIWLPENLQVLKKANFKSEFTHCYTNELKKRATLKSPVSVAQPQTKKRRLH